MSKSLSCFVFLRFLSTDAAVCPPAEQPFGRMVFAIEVLRFAIQIGVACSLMVFVRRSVPASRAV